MLTLTLPSRARLVLIVLMVGSLAGTACAGTSTDDARDTNAVRTTSEPPAPTDGGARDAMSGPSEELVRDETQDEEDDGYLAAEDVAAYIERFEAAQAVSYLSIDGTKELFLHISAEEHFEFTTVSSELFVALGDDGIEGASLSYAGSNWDVSGELDYQAVPEALDPEDGEGEVLHVTFPLTNSEDDTQVVEVEMLLDVNLIGGGSSQIEVIDHYALISGTLGTSTYTQLSDIMSDQPQVDTLVLTQVDGSENDEINVHTARLIRDAGWTTWVAANGDISSGGVDMFAAGVKRYVEPGAFVGVHSWAGDDGTVGSDFPRDDPAHRSQLEYFRAMLGEEAGPEFYFYTLEASPAEMIHRMSPEEIQTYGLMTGEPPAPLSATIVGDLSAGYLQLTEGSYLKFLVDSCDFDGNSGEADVISTDLGEGTIIVANGSGELVFDQLDEQIANHTVSNVVLVDGTFSAEVNIDLGPLVNADTSHAELVLPCTD